jgi:twitching motility protein PilT
VDERVSSLLQLVADRGGSDLLFAPGAPATARVHGTLERLSDTILTADESRSLGQALAGERWDELLVRRELDFSFSFAETSRVRANLFFQRGTLAGALRFVPYDIPTLEELGAPAICGELIDRANGLVLVTGPTGAGKSTTVASMIDRINRTRAVHIITIEDPIEYVHRHRRSMVVQRELGSDTLDFAGALRSALREDPDVVQVGEMRDLETIATAITAAETGHLVFATLHTQDAPQTIDRIIDVFPPHQQQQVRVQLATTLQGVVTQQLLQTADGHGRAVSSEVLVCTPAVRNLIREGKTHQIYSIMQAGGRFGMQTMDQSLANLVKLGAVSQQLAYERCHDPEELNRLIGGGGSSFDAGYGAAAAAGIVMGDY